MSRSRFTNGQDKGERGSPSGTPIGRALLIPQTPLAEDLYRAVRAVASVHGDGPLPPIPVHLVPKRGQSRGQFRFGPDTAPSIWINLAFPFRAFALAHEIGHFLDYSGIGEPAMFASETAEELGPWRSSVRASRGFERLLHRVSTDASFPSVGRTQANESFLSLPELWARSYAQNITILSDDPALWSGLAEYRPSQPNQEEDPGRLLHWDDDDFAPNAGAIETLLRRLGWRSGP